MRNLQRINIFDRTICNMKEAKTIVKAAAIIAKKLHEGQVDKAGEDYFMGHLSSVSSMGETWQEQVVGYLHDASEDTPHTVKDILDMLDEEIGTPLSWTERDGLDKALRLLNHHLSEDRESYIRAIAENPLASSVKLNDLAHNMDLSRLPNPTEKDYKRVERYKQEYDYLSKRQVREH